MGEPCTPNNTFPMILDNITDEMQIAKEETFGPIVCLSTFDNVEDAINSTNSTGFGLGGVVYGHKDRKGSRNCRLA